jgi:metal-dependent hydrolase (beta-lactamase superfamily II)
VQSLRITVLSTMLADRGIGEWGFAALVEADGRRILFDTGARRNTVLTNAKEPRAPGVWLTGPVPRIHDERNWSGRRTIERDGRWVEDDLPGDMSLVFDTDRGLVVLAGCGHAGLVNTIAHARASIRGAPIHAAIGGFHLLDADDAKLAWTAEQLDAAGLARFVIWR